MVERAQGIDWGFTWSLDCGGKSCLASEDNWSVTWCGTATLIAVLGGAISTIFFAWAGIQWMMAAGDPQKISQARMSLIGAAVGLIIVGAAFIVPEVISERIIEPAGGTAGLSCDRVLKNQFVFQRAASTAERMNAVIKQIQAQRAECASDIWGPIVWEATPDFQAAGCIPDDAGEFATIGDTDVPRGLEIPGDNLEGAVSLVSRRDADNNIIVHWDFADRPTDSARCWLYVDRLKTWDQEY